MGDKKDLELNTDSIAKRSGVRSSLTDINQLPIFTDEFEEHKASMENAVAEEELTLRNAIFGIQVRQEDAIELTNKLFMDNAQESIIRNGQIASEGQTAGILPGLYIIVLLIAIWVGIRIRRKEQEKNHVDNQS